MDPAQLQWSSREDFLSYTSTMARSMLQEHSPPPNVAEWHGNILHGLKLKWGNVWDRMHNKKEVAFIWSI